MFQDLLEPDYGIDQSPPDATRINQVILYFDDNEIADLKELAKQAMKIEMPNDYEAKGNLSDLFLLLLKRHYGSAKISSSALFL